MNNMDAEQFGRLLTELQALRMEIRRFNDRFDVVSQKHGERSQGWINEMDLSRPPQWNTRFNDRFDVVSQKHGERPQGWINVVKS